MVRSERRRRKEREEGKGRGKPYRRPTQVLEEKGDPKGGEETGDKELGKRIW
jgi:hypothetical protein